LSPLVKKKDATLVLMPSAGLLMVHCFFSKVVQKREHINHAQDLNLLTRSTSIKHSTMKQKATTTKDQRYHQHQQH
jgi:hypothetical protein